MIGTSEPVTGEEALSLGLVTIGAEHEEELLQKAKTLAGKFAEKSPQSMASLLELLYSNKVYSYDGGLKLEAKRFGKHLHQMTQKKAFRHFSKKKASIRWAKIKGIRI